MQVCKLFRKMLKFLEFYGEMQSLYQIKRSELKASIKDADVKLGIVTGYFSNFNNVDSDGDIIRPGAFAKTIRENGPQSSSPRIKHLYNHSPYQPLGKLQVLTEDAKGLYYESRLGTHSLGQDFIKMVESELITEHSVGFQTIKRNQLQDYEGYMRNPAGGWFELVELKLWEGSSLSAWGANELTPITGLKSAAGLNAMIERQKALENFCRKSTATDETIELLLLETKQLTQTIFEIMNDKATQPGSTVPDASIETIKNFISQLN